jgi:hypothetical protein
MNFFGSLFISASGLFDFDLTFPAEASLFIILALVVTFVFISPISKQIDTRAEFINYNLRKSVIILTFGYEKLSKCVELLTKEIDELNRQIKLVKNYTNSEFEEELFSIQNKNAKILSKLKGDLAIKSAYLFSNINNDLVSLADTFFIKKFESVS